MKEDHELRSLLETLLAAQVLTLAKTLEAAARAKNTQGGDFEQEAINLIRQRGEAVLARIR
jgi:hypothetical protein